MNVTLLMDDLGKSLFHVVASMRAGSITFAEFMIEQMLSNFIVRSVDSTEMSDV